MNVWSYQENLTVTKGWVDKATTFFDKYIVVLHRLERFRYKLLSVVFGVNSFATPLTFLMSIVSAILSNCFPYL